MNRNANNQAASWFMDLKATGRIDLNPPYQRRSVWNTAYQQFFIDSIIRNYPAPSIFLQVERSPGELTMYRVIDGKQRLTALFDFQKDLFPTSESLEDLGFANMYYSELPEETKVAILEYVFTVETLKTTSPAELNEAFDRLNRNVARLNKQELRHAKYDGAFVKKVEGLAEHRFWTEVGLSTPARIRRMLDVEQVSELYIISMDGTQEGKDYIDSYYASNDAEIKNEELTEERFHSVQDFVHKLNAFYPLKGTRFTNVADFYSLWAAATDLFVREGLPKPQSAAQRLATFTDEIEEAKTDRARNYHLAAVQGSNKKPNRDLRAKALAMVLRGE
ncbi:DUF262 domain-containing protein [Saccharopolyspora sp. NFXS83]|uniref:DUF262 domain-containing protein n=1 Tax=Saccharopolyspora sp. NFXS83 TaxID=2993560 RepID=UPI00224B86FD|nr:DUF262 domain-containing protein [Saccharopolyspora sp. NFXS83]MCX2728816.1 DUF262 domain-containing protein [Saccharopolyspora sp. NFXS83]